MLFFPIDAWTDRAMRPAPRMATTQSTHPHLPYTQVWELMELCLLADGAGAAGWEVVAWAAPFWGQLPEPGACFACLRDCNGNS